MHISDGVLSWPVLAAGTLMASGGIAAGLKATDYRKMPQVAVFTSLFFVGSLIHVPLGPAGAHMVLNGLAGVVLGWAVFPALFIGLLLQAVIFSHGGITAVGVNTLNMALPGVVCWKLFGMVSNKPAAGFIAGFTGVAGSLIMLAACLILSESAFMPAVKLLVAGHLPVAAAEGFVTAAAVGFLLKTCPEIIGNSHAH